MYRPIVLAPLLLLLAVPAATQRYDLVVDRAASASDVTTTFAAELPGDVIGDWDAVSNPGGTRTLPGLFGGSGNQAIPIDVTYSGTADFATPLAGALSVDLDLAGLSIAVEGMDLDLLGGGTVPADATATLAFDTFRTFQPDFFNGLPGRRVRGGEHVELPALVPGRAGVEHVGRGDRRLLPVTRSAAWHARVAAAGANR